MRPDRSNQMEPGTNRRAMLSMLTAVLAVGTLSGCASDLFYNLQPHRLWRMNSTPSTRRDASSVYYSVPDPIPALIDRSATPHEI